MNGDPGRNRAISGCSTDGGQDLLFAETLSKRDKAGVGSLIGGTRAILLFMILSFSASVVLVVGISAFTFSLMFGGIDVALTFVNEVLTERPLLAAAVLLVTLLSVAGPLVVINAVVRRLRQLFAQQVHVQVTDAGLTVQREGIHYWQSSGIDIPFEVITAVEYLSPDKSSICVELDDWRGPKFFAGRRQTWIRIERGNDSVVFVGTDRVIELAETLAQHSPNVETAKPY